MGKVRFHLPDDLQKELDRIAKEIAATRSHAIRTIMNEGINALRLKRALDQYQAGKISRQADREGVVPARPVT